MYNSGTLLMVSNTVHIKSIGVTYNCYYSHSELEGVSVVLGLRSQLGVELLHVVVGLRGKEVGVAVGGVLSECFESVHSKTGLLRFKDSRF